MLNFIRFTRRMSVEEIGIKLQAAARKAFPSLIGKVHDRLMKCVLTASSQAILLGTAGSLGGGLKPPGGREAIPTQTKF